MSIDDLEQASQAGQPGARRRTSGIDRALQILDYLQDEARPATAYEIARGVGAPLSTIYVIVDDLVSKNMLSRATDGSIWLGHRLYHYGLSYARNLDLLSVATDEMRILANASGEVVQVCGRDGHDMVVLAMEEGPVHFQVAARIGTRSPLNWTASGRLLVGHLSAEERLAIYKATARPSPTGRAETDPQVLADSAGEAFRHKLSIQAGESNFSVACIAAPIIDRAGVCQATMSIVVPEGKVNQKEPDLIEMVKESAVRVEARLGWL